MHRTPAGLLGLLGLLAAWEAADRSGLLDPVSVPPPSTVGVRLAELFGTIASAVDWLVPDECGVAARQCPMATAEFVGSLCTYSNLIVLPDADREHVLDAVRDFLATHPDTAGRDTLEVPFTATCFRTHLRHP